MKTTGEIAGWLEEHLSYDSSGSPECPTCGAGGLRYWIDHKDPLVDDLMVFLGLWRRAGFPRGTIRDELYRIMEEGRITGERGTDAQRLAGQIIERIFGGTD